ncbi:MAG: potassium-transporting ATPase subunit F [Deltaproteobacteria bacterium]|jgi:K+-transporting ATPase KdpF subunit|nr:potassium-transporting ATPase subunit F [Deltaproteobacteria bacterium]MBK8714207.1 potassium-transporting ATPase subunit F [Deltaproteobacteria bacterium]MBP7286001.1 potassium-transporting ATPase subunit F [Nannocystaceae bacterium]
MTFDYPMAAILAALLCIYLVHALVRAEKY